MRVVGVGRVDRAAEASAIRRDGSSTGDHRRRLQLRGRPVTRSSGSREAGEDARCEWRGDSDPQRPARVSWGDVGRSTNPPRPAPYRARRDRSRDPRAGRTAPGGRAAHRAGQARCRHPHPRLPPGEGRRRPRPRSRGRARAVTGARRGADPRADPRLADGAGEGYCRRDPRGQRAPRAGDRRLRPHGPLVRALPRRRRASPSRSPIRPTGRPASPTTATGRPSRSTTS